MNDIHLKKSLCLSLRGYASSFVTLTLIRAGRNLSDYPRCHHVLQMRKLKPRGVKWCDQDDAEEVGSRGRLEFSWSFPARGCPTAVGVRSPVGLSSHRSRAQAKAPGKVGVRLSMNWRQPSGRSRRCSSISTPSWVSNPWTSQGNTVEPHLLLRELSNKDNCGLYKQCSCLYWSCVTHNLVQL